VTFDAAFAKLLWPFVEGFFITAADIKREMERCNADWESMFDACDKAVCF